MPFSSGSVPDSSEKNNTVSPLLMMLIMPFCGNDTVYDPQTNTHVSYGEILNAYYAKVSEQLMAGGSSESLTNFINAYFSSLYDGSKDD